MGKVSPKRRKFIIKKKRKRREKIKKLRERYFQSQDPKERQKIIEKLKRVAPHLNLEEVLNR